MANDEGQDLETIDGNTAAVVAELCSRLEGVEEIGGEGPTDLRVLVVPHGKRVIDLLPYEDARLEAPRRRKGTALVTTLGSLIDLIDRYKDAGSVVFADDNPKAPKLVAVLDYNFAQMRATDESAEIDGGPRFGQHRIVYSYPLSDAFLCWTAFAARGRVSQGDLAEFLEERLGDVLEVAAVPESTRKVAAQLQIKLAGSAALVQCARALAVRVDAKVVSAVNLSTGEGQISYQETHENASDAGGGAKLEIPGGFVIAIPVVRGAQPYPVICRLRYRVQNGTIGWYVLLHRREEIFADTIAESVAEVEKETGLPVYLGTPEV